MSLRIYWFSFMCDCVHPPLNHFLIRHPSDWYLVCRIKKWFIFIVARGVFLLIVASHMFQPGHAGTVRLYSPPFVLAPMKTKQLQLAESCGKDPEVSNTLFCAYCLSEDQRWLLATCTDERGEMMETCTINIEIPNRYEDATAVIYHLCGRWCGTIMFCLLGIRYITAAADHRV